MGDGFHLFGAAHVAILAGVVALGVGISRILRPATRYALGGVMAANELAWYAFRLHEEGFRFPEGLPLQICDLTLWLTVIAVVRLHPLAYEVAYFAGIGGSGMALLTPDLWAPFPSYPTTYFFLSHGLVVATLLALSLSGAARPRPGAVWRVFGILNAYVAAVACFNAVFQTNYAYLCRKPEHASVLDSFGPWPVYVAAAEVFALAIFQALLLPFRVRKKRRA